MLSQKCTLFSRYDKTKENGLFFSTTWCRDRLFLSDNPEDISEFFDTFTDRTELVEWMKEKPKGRAETIEVDGNKEIIVVVPTADFNGKYAKECREKTFKGLHIIFVESGYPRDPYFNYAHNCNIGIKKAMEYNPKWIVLSNDDVFKGDEPEKLVSILQTVDNSKYEVLFPISEKNKIYLKQYLGKRRFTYDIYRFLADRKLSKYYRKFHIDFFYAYDLLKLKLLFKRVPGTDYVFWYVQIYSANYLGKMGEDLFDETYINDSEDTDLALRLSLLKVRIKIIKYEIGAVGGGSLGLGRDRELRQVIGRAYFNFKHAETLETLLKTLTH